MSQTIDRERHAVAKEKRGPHNSCQEPQKIKGTTHSATPRQLVLRGSRGALGAGIWVPAMLSGDDFL